ncbi:UPF0326 domain-containing protein [Fusarium pseudocircinatum]|uniref:UPF0326 domain-containing protein n=1 Tax=Fusarium pseudocircinatum TaxID=56676 RepID=A0A8H5NVN4_9HYPO|nr:UPF0326 domain-containing protein [Fusarium pseudocircinatum]
MPRHKKSSSVSRSHRSTLSLSKTEITIHVYDLLPPGRLSSVLWTVGASLLHSGVVINGREYAYGGHDKRGLTGVYWTKPRTEPPGGTFRCEILHGFTLATEDEINATLQSASEEFLGTSYNLLTKNCNHFTSYLCKRLTGQSGPAWLNRAASIGVALPCVVPRDWIEPPEYDTSEGALLDDYDNSNDDNSHTLKKPTDPHLLMEDNESNEDDEWDSAEERRRGGSGKGKQALRDSAGRRLPPAERAIR